MNTSSDLSSALGAQTNPVLRRLDARLGHLFHWATESRPYADIWDLCCDHGRLGLHLYHGQEAANSNVHLIDCVPEIVDKLRFRYSSWLGDRLRVRCLNAGAVDLPRSGRQLVFIAGVSSATVAALLAEIIQGLQSEPPRSAEFQLEFMLSPNFSTFELRAFLRRGPFELLKEQFVSARGHHHEHLHLRYHPQEEIFNRVSLVGDSIWSPLDNNKKKYLTKFLKHYQNCAKLAGDPLAQVAVDAYRNVLTNFPDANVGN